jgi:CheY-like chemotaxis protein
VQLENASARSADSCEEALRLARELLPDVVLLDIQMPIMDGLTALPEIKKLCGHDPVKRH